MSNMDTETTQLQLGNRVDLKFASARETPQTSVGSRFSRALTATANVASRVVASAGYALPGATVIGAAVTGAGAVRDAAGMSGVGTGTVTAGVGATSGSLAVSGGLGGYDAMAPVRQRAAGGDSNAQLMLATQQMQEMNQSFNLQYLGLQQKMQSENREYSALSNIMKTRHDTAKNALSNLK